jgi:hypothetical protein
MFLCGRAHICRTVNKALIDKIAASTAIWRLSPFLLRLILQFLDEVAVLPSHLFDRHVDVAVANRVQVSFLVLMLGLATITEQKMSSRNRIHFGKKDSNKKPPTGRWLCLV